MSLDRIPFREVLEHLTELSDAAGVEMILVGATARDIALVAENQDAALRATNDVDIAVAVQDAEAFMRLTSSLTPMRRGVAHKFTVMGVEVDIVPFGGIESPERTITWPDGAVMNTLGFAEAVRSGLRIKLGGERTLLVASLAAQAALKIFAWADRNDRTERDAVDLRTLIDAYSAADRFDDLYAEGNQGTLAHYEYDVRHAGAHLLGADVRDQLGGLVAARCVQTIGTDDSRAFEWLSRAMRADVAENANLLVALRSGLGSEG